MKKFAMFKVTIPIAIDSEMYRRLEDLAKMQNCSIDAMVDSVVQLGVYGHIKGNLPTYEQAYSE